MKHAKIDIESMHVDYIPLNSVQNFSGVMTYMEVLDDESLNVAFDNSVKTNPPFGDASDFIYERNFLPGQSFMVTCVETETYGTIFGLFEYNGIVLETTRHWYL